MMGAGKEHGGLRTHVPEEAALFGSLADVTLGWRLERELMR